MLAPSLHELRVEIRTSAHHHHVTLCPLCDGSRFLRSDHNINNEARAAGQLTPPGAARSGLLLQCDRERR